jgi:hypothetical protein
VVVQGNSVYAPLFAEAIHNQLQTDIYGISQQDKDVAEAGTDDGQRNNNQQGDQTQQQGVFC